MFDTSDTFDIRKKQLKMKVKLMLIRKKISWAFLWKSLMRNLLMTDSGSKVNGLGGIALWSFWSTWRANFEFVCWF